LRILLLILGIVLVVYCTAGVLLDTRFSGDLAMEERLCRFRLCDNEMVSRRARVALWQEGNTAEAITLFNRLLNRDSHAPFRWTDLGDAYVAADRKQDAEYCFRQAQVLAPKWPPVLLRVANFYFQTGNTDAALPITSQILAQVDAFDGVIFSEYTRLVDRVEDVLAKGLPPDPRASRAFLIHCTQFGKLGDAEKTWDWVRAHGFADTKTANAYVTYLLAHHRPQDARVAWKDYLGVRARGYGESNYIFNGDFENEPEGSPLDWIIQRVEGVDVAREEGALRIRFDGKHNLASTGVRQTIALPAGTYVLRARMRTEGITTDQGFRLHLAAEGNSWSSPALPGTNAWAQMEHTFTVPGGEYAVEVMRTPSLKFDSLVAGTLWMDDVRIEPARR
jgi:hypothetical protein